MTALPENFTDERKDVNFSANLNPIRLLITGHFNGVSIEIRSLEEATWLCHMGSFGKGSLSRSRPQSSLVENGRKIMRKRQYLKRLNWAKKFKNFSEANTCVDFLKDIELLTAKIVAAGEKQKNIVDLVSSDEDDNISFQRHDSEDSANNDSYRSLDKHDIIVVVPNSDSEGENYFENFKPKCCVSKVKVNEKLILTLEEAYFLAFGLGCLQLVDYNSKVMSLKHSWQVFSEVEKNFLTKYVVYHYFRSKGYIVKPGIKFGGDYLLYTDGPGINHAKYIVIIKFSQINCDWMTMIGHIRMASTTVKELLIVEVKSPNKSTLVMPEDLDKFTVQELLISKKNLDAKNYN